MAAGPSNSINRTPLAGAGGSSKSGGGSTRAAREEADSLRSKAFGRLLDAVSEGPIVGPVLADGTALDSAEIGRAIYLDEAPLQNSDGSFNFKNVKAEFVPGTPDQDHLPGFESEEADIAVSVRMKEAGDGVVRAITNPDVDAVRVTVRIPSLIYQDQKTGDVRGYNVTYAIDIQNNGGGYEEKIVRTVAGKNSTPYLIGHRLDLEGSGPWDIRVRRVSANEAKGNIQNETWFDSYAEIIDGKFRHPYTALFGLEIDAEQFSRIPNVAYRLKGRIINVPVNYDPVARTYSGNWNGTFKLAWTDNPAWVFYDLATNIRYGLGRWITPAMVDKWALYQISQISDTVVSDGKGGTEPLYRCNLMLETAVDAYRALNDLASVFHGMAYWGAGTFTAVTDAASDPVAQFTNQNVEEGKFEYSGSSKTARHTVCYVRWNDPDDFYRPKLEYVPDDDGLLKYGVNDIEVTAHGCTSRAQAIRRGRHVILTEKLATDAISFACGVDGAFVRPGNVFKVMDRYRAGKPFGGRVVALPTTTTVTLDRDLVVEAGKTYNISFVRSDGVLVERAISNGVGTYRTVTVSVALTGGDIPGVMSIWIIRSNTIDPQYFQCVGIKEEGPLKYRIVGVRYNSSKYAAITGGIALQTLPTGDLQNPRLVRPPGEVQIVEENTQTPITYTNFLALSWAASDDQYLRGYRVYWRFEGGNWQQMAETVAPNARIPTNGAGLYEFRVTAVNTVGFESGAQSVTYSLAASSPVTAAKITGLEIFDQANDPEFQGREVKVVWRVNSPFYHDYSNEPNGGDSGFEHPLFKDYLVSVYDAVTSTLLRQEGVKDTSYVFSYEKNAESSLAAGFTTPRRRVRFKVQVRDKTNSVGVPGTLTVDNPSPVAPVYTASQVFGGVQLDLVKPGDLDFAGFMIHLGDTGFTPSGVIAGDGNCVYAGPDTKVVIPLPLEVTRYIRITAYDDFGKDGLNYTPEFTITPLVTIDTVPPATPTGLALATEVFEQADGTQKAKIVATWTANTEEDATTYSLRYKKSADGPTAWSYLTISGKTSTRAEFVVDTNVGYDVQLSCSDRSGNASAYTATSSITSAKDTGAPSAPTAVALVAGIRLIEISCDLPTATDLAEIEIYRNTTNSMPGTPYKVDAVVRSTAGTQKWSFVDANVVQGQTYYYWLIAKDSSGNPSAATASVNATPGQTQSADVADFAIGVTKRFHSTIALSGDVWTDNSPASGRIAWNAHTLYFQGAAYSITAGNTPVGHKYVYWDAASPTVYQTSATNPTLTDSQFYVATNSGGAHDLAWNALANLVVKSAFIESLAVEKLDAGTISAKTFVLGDAGNQANSIIQSYGFVDGSAGWRIRGNGDAQFNNLIARGFAAVLGATAASVGTAAGLYLGSDKMGYWNGSAWRSYMDSGGGFYLTGAGSNSLTWDGTSLTINGKLDAGTGIERTVIDGTTFYRGNAGGNRAELYSNTASAYTAFRAYNSSGALVLILGTEISNGYGMLRLHTALGVEKLFLDGNDGTITFSNVLRGPFNGASTPTYTFTSRSGDGLYSTAAGGVGLALNGKKALDFTESSNSFGIEFGAGRSGDGIAFMDFIGKSGDDYGIRVFRNGGLNAASGIFHKGTGALTIFGEDGGNVILSIAAGAQLTMSGSIAMTGTSFTFNGSTLGDMSYRNVHISTSSPSGGSDGDVWLQY